MAGELPAHARAAAAVAMIEDLTTAESAVLTAAVRWVNFTTGELWPSVGEWTRTARVSARGFHKIMKRLAVRGLVQVVKATKGGRGATTVYRIPALAVNNPAPECGVSTPETPHLTPHSEQGNPALGDTKPRTADHNPALGTINPAQLVRTNIQEQPLNNHQHPSGNGVVAVVLDSGEGIPKDQLPVFEALILAGVGDRTARKYAENEFVKLDDVRRISSRRKEQGKPPDHTLIAEIRTAATAEKIRAERRANQGATA